MKVLEQENANLKEENAVLKQTINSLSEQLTVAQEQIKKLTAQLKQNSRNSNWPSSRDKSRQKPKPKSLRIKTGRKPGGQQGHKGHTLEFQAKPDFIEVHRPASCEHCRASLAEVEAEAVSKRQVLDLPPLRFLTTEHQAETVACPCCGEKTMADFPEGVTQPVQYGSGVKQLAVYLRTEQFVPYERSRQLLADLFDLPISTGTLQNMMVQAAEAVKPATEAIKAALIESEVAHADETGFYINGQRHWLHTFSTPELTHFDPHPRRGYVATEEIGILPHFEGKLVHDAWATYFKYQLIHHALCNAHHLRDLTALVENEGQDWATFMFLFLLAAKELVAEAQLAGQTELPAEQLERLHQLYDAILAFGFGENPLPEEVPPKGKRGRRKKTKARNLLERFQNRQSAVLAFVYDFKVPFDNNLAERDIRMMKVQQKVSGCFRSSEGAKQFARLRSYISTIRKQGLNVWDALGSLFSDSPLIPLPTPV